MFFLLIFYLFAYTFNRALILKICIQNCHTNFAGKRKSACHSFWKNSLIFFYATFPYRLAKRKRICKSIRYNDAWCWRYMTPFQHMLSATLLEWSCFPHFTHLNSPHIDLWSSKIMLCLCLLQKRSLGINPTSRSHYKVLFRVLSLSFECKVIIYFAKWEKGT